METYLDCLPCFVRQALEASRMATHDEKVQRRVLDSIMERLPKLSFHVTPPEIAQVVHGLVKDITGKPDPYREIKIKQNKMALNLYPHVKRILARSEDRLLNAVKIAIAGNVIDLGVQSELPDIEDSIRNSIFSELTINNYDKFKEALMNSVKILYLGDNAGEIVFDKILIEEIIMLKDVEITFVVRGKPVINDATMEDADLVGIKECARVISNGSDAPATILSQCSSDVRKLFSEADMVIAKGQGNYESLSENDNVFFLLKAKCPVVARRLGVNVDDAILKGW